MLSSSHWLIALAAVLGFVRPASAQFNNGAGVATSSPPLVITAGNIACATCTTSAGALVSGKILTGSGLQAMASSNVTLTNPATGATLTLVDGGTLVTAGAFSLTLQATAPTVSIFPAGTHSLAPLDNPVFTGSVTSGGSFVAGNASFFIAPGNGGLYFNAGTNPNITDVGDTLTFSAFASVKGTLTGSAFAALGTPANGTIQNCSDCTVTSAVDNTCAAAGGGAIALRIAGAWKCVI